MSAHFLVGDKPPGRGHREALSWLKRPTILSWLHSWRQPSLLACDLQTWPEGHLFLRIFMRKSALLLILAVSIAIQAQDLKPIQLPPAQTEGGRPLMQVLKGTENETGVQPREAAHAGVSQSPLGCVRH